MQFVAQLTVTSILMQQQGFLCTGCCVIHQLPLIVCSSAGRHRSFMLQLILPHAADHFWWTDDPLETATDFFQPNEFAPHCLPCHWTPDHEQQAVGDGKKYQPFTPYTGCPCTVEHICRHDTRKLYKEACDAPLDHLPFRSDTICLRQLQNRPVHQFCLGFHAGYSYASLHG